MSDTVKLSYAASSNITFRGDYDTGYTREEWDDLTAPEQNEVITDALYYLVDIWVED